MHLGMTAQHWLPPWLQFLVRVFGEPSVAMVPGWVLRPGPVPPHGRIDHLPRLDLGVVTLARECWRLRRGDLLPRGGPLELASWLRGHGLPRRFFARVLDLRDGLLAGLLGKHRKPMYVDVTDPFLLAGSAPRGPRPRRPDGRRGDPARPRGRPGLPRRAARHRVRHPGERPMTSWESAHLFHTGDLDDLIRAVVTPLVPVGDGLPSSCATGSPVRTCACVSKGCPATRSGPGPTRGSPTTPHPPSTPRPYRRLAAVLAEGSAATATTPSFTRPASVVFLPYEPEEHVYGDMPAAERHFGVSSSLALDVLHGVPGWSAGPPSAWPCSR